MNIVRLLLIYFVTVNEESFGFKEFDLYNFGIFENFVANEHIFRHELTIKNHLVSVHNHLKETQVSLMKYLNGPRFISHDARTRLSHDSRALWQHYVASQGAVNVHLYANSTTTSPMEIMHGAFKALVVMQETYHLDPVALSNGKVMDNWGEEKLEIEDLLDMSDMAVRYNFMATAVDFLRAAKARAKATRDSSPQFSKGVENIKFVDTHAQKVVAAHNKLVNTKKAEFSSHSLHPYMVDEDTLLRKKKQPKFVKAIPTSPLRKREDVQDDFLKQAHFFKVCNKKIVGEKVVQERPKQKCLLLHHRDPYLKLGPFKFEQRQIEPFRVVYHDLLSDREMDFLVDYSTPRLSNARIIPKSNRALTAADKANPKKGKTVSKTNQVWLQDIVFKEKAVYDLVTKDPLDYVLRELKDPYSYSVQHEVLLKLSRKLELATQLNVTERFATSQYQVTNYGIGGLCEVHMDPQGFFDGRELVPERANTVSVGDYIATLMAWLKDPAKSGAGTAFVDSHGYADVVMPEKGAAAFWMDLWTGGKKDGRSQHGGCPVVAKSKWILNKWFNSYSQWDKIPCSIGKKGEDAIKMYPRSAFAA